MRPKPIFVDLFSGAGGMSLGLELAGLERVLAVEASPMAGQTYYRNLIDPELDAWETHRKAPLSDQLSSGLGVAKTSDVLDDWTSVTRALRGREVDLVAGGPPCQGFSLAGLRRPGDARNLLPFEFVRFVDRLSPKLVVIENVPGIRARFEATGPERQLAPAEALRELLDNLRPGYQTKVLQVDASNFGVAQRRPRVLIIGIRKDFATNQHLDALEAWAAARPEVFAKAHSALGDLTESGYRNWAEDDYPEDLALARRLRFEDALLTGPMATRATPMVPPNHDLRSHGADVTSRFRLMAALEVAGIASDVLSTAARAEPERREEAIDLFLAERAPNLVFPLMGYGQAVAVSYGDLKVQIERLRSKKHSQRMLRPDWPAPTMLSLPDDHVHWVDPRTLTVREMARLQSFPDRFIFFDKVTTGGKSRRREVPQYTQVGNAVPPLLARSLGGMMLSILDEIGVVSPVMVA